MLYISPPRRPQAYRLSEPIQRTYIVHRSNRPPDLSDAVQRLIHTPSRPHVVFALTHPLHIEQLSGPAGLAQRR